MKAIIISDADARALLDQLELIRLRGDVLRTNPTAPPTLDEIHRAFNFVVSRWLQEQGADVVRR